MAFLIRITGPRETDENRPVSPGSAALEEMKMEDHILKFRNQLFICKNGDGSLRENMLRLMQNVSGTIGRNSMPQIPEQLKKPQTNA
ncbi:hypothetical protein ACTXT7_014149 [Hymenolepis weldensis]